MAPDQRYPLTWPDSWPRTEPHRRTYGRFGKRETTASGYRALKDVTVYDGAQRVMVELERMGARDIIVSTNLQLRRDGLPRSDQREPGDPGVAVYWTDRAKNERCIAVDRYTKVADNLAAIAATLDAMRAIERHGGAEILNRAFTGFTALGHDGSRKWWDVLGCASDAPRHVIESHYLRRRSATHPDRGGDSAEFHAVQQAWEQARETL